MPDVNLAHIVYKRFEERAICNLQNRQAFGLRPVIVTKGVAEFDDYNTRLALYDAYLETVRELRQMVNNLKEPA